MSFLTLVLVADFTESSDNQILFFLLAFVMKPETRFRMQNVSQESTPLVDFRYQNAPSSYLQFLL